MSPCCAYTLQQQLYFWEAGWVFKKYTAGSGCSSSASDDELRGCLQSMPGLDSVFSLQILMASVNGPFAGMAQPVALAATLFQKRSGPFHSNFLGE